MLPLLCDNLTFCETVRNKICFSIKSTNLDILKLLNKYLDLRNSYLYELLRLNLHTNPKFCGHLAISRIP